MRRSFCRARVRRHRRSRRRSRRGPDARPLAPRARRRASARMSGVLRSVSVRPLVRLLHLLGRASLRRVVGDGGRHDDGVGGLDAAPSPPRASRRRSAPARPRRPAGGSIDVGPATSVTAAPRRAASAATANPIRPLDRLPMKRTGSRSSKVGPAVTSTRRPAQRPAGRSTPVGRRDNVVRLGEPALANPAARQIALARLDEAHAARRERRQVLPHRRVLQHVRVHRRRQSTGARGRQVERRQEVVGDAVRRTCR